MNVGHRLTTLTKENDLRTGKTAEIATELGRTRAAVMNRKQVLGIAQKMTAARGSKMPYTAYDKTRTTNTGVKNAKQEGIDLKAELEKEVEAGNLPSADAMLVASSQAEKVSKAIKAAKAYNKTERKEVKAMAEVSEALNKIIRNSKKKHRNAFN